MDDGGLGVGVGLGVGDGFGATAAFKWVFSYETKASGFGSSWMFTSLFWRTHRMRFSMIHF